MSKIEVNTVAPQCGTTLTLGESGDTVTLGTGASQSGFGRTGTVDWQTSSIKTSTFTAVNGEGYFANTSGGAFTMNLPAGSAGAIVSVVDYTNTFQTHNLTVSPNGSEKIGGVAASIGLSTEGQSVTFVYVDANEGWKNTMDSTSNVIGNPNLVATGGTITTTGDFKIHTFTGPGTFTVNQVSTTAANNTVSYMVVAGGGGANAGGGGGGGFREYKSPVDTYTASPLNGNPGGTAVTVTAQAYPITVGGGGAAAVSCNSSVGPRGTSGANSIFSTITSTGGGGGGVANSNACAPGGPGGSGGGSGRAGCYSPGPTTIVGGIGNTPSVSPSQGNNGSLGATGGWASGAGGGAGAAAANSSPGSAGSPGADNGAAGGAGVGTEINPAVGTPGPSGPLKYFAGGGGGEDYRNPPNGAAGPTNGGGGVGGGGDANVSPGSSSGLAGPNVVEAGTTNSGGGGGGGAYSSPTPTDYRQKPGGSGIVVIRYKYQ